MWQEKRTWRVFDSRRRSWSVSCWPDEVRREQSRPVQPSGLYRFRFVSFLFFCATLTFSVDNRRRFMERRRIVWLGGADVVAVLSPATAAILPPSRPFHDIKWEWLRGSPDPDHLIPPLFLFHLNTSSLLSATQREGEIKKNEMKRPGDTAVLTSIIYIIYCLGFRWILERYQRAFRGGRGDTWHWIEATRGGEERRTHTETNKENFDGSFEGNTKKNYTCHYKSGKRQIDSDGDGTRDASGDNPSTNFDEWWGDLRAVHPHPYRHPRTHTRTKHCTVMNESRRKRILNVGSVGPYLVER